MGWVLERRPYDPDYPDSTFQSYLVKWVGDEEELQLSPWDMETIPDDLGNVRWFLRAMMKHSNKPSARSKCNLRILFVVVSDEAEPWTHATQEEIRSSLYQSTRADWELPGDQITECQRMSDLIKAVMNLTIAKPFLTPADLLSCSAYSYEITYPMGLSIIKARLDNLFYRRSQAILMDVERITIITEKLNPPHSDMATHAKVVADLLRQIARYTFIHC